MARPLRISLAGAWYHVTGRGNERKEIFREDTDREHFLSLLEEMVGRYEVVMHSYGLMDNHYHLIMETPGANLSAAMQWLGVSYSMWFNRRHHRVGHLFQGRFKGIVLDPTRALQLSRYTHLNPVRVKRFRLDKKAREQARVGAMKRPERWLVQERLKYLRGYKWSSYGSYVGRRKVPAWLTVHKILKQIGGSKTGQQQMAYRKYVEDEVRQGLRSNPWEDLKDQLLLGNEDFVQEMESLIRGDEQEQRPVRSNRKRPSWDQIVRAVEKVKGESWHEFGDRHGDWGRDMALYVGRKQGGLKLQELAQLVKASRYATVAMAVYRMSKKVEGNRETRKRYNLIIDKM